MCYNLLTCGAGRSCTGRGETGAPGLVLMPLSLNQDVLFFSVKYCHDIIHLRLLLRLNEGPVCVNSLINTNNSKYVINLSLSTFTSYFVYIIHHIVENNCSTHKLWGLSSNPRTNSWAPLNKQFIQSSLF